MPARFGARRVLGAGRGGVAVHVESRQVAMWGDSITLGQGASDAAHTRPGIIDALSGYIAYNGGVGGELASQIADRVVADTAHKGWVSIFGLGRNSDFGTGNGRLSIISHIQRCIDHIGHQHYVVSAILPRTDETDGTGGTSATGPRDSLNLMNDLIKTSFPGVHNQVDRQIAAVCTDPGNVPPASLLSDGLLHYNDAGYALLEAEDKVSLDALDATYPVAIDTTPDAFAFTAQAGVTGVIPSNTATSNTVQVTGINSAAPISISGGQYSINGGAYTSADGTVVNGDLVTVQLTASASLLTTVTATVTIGGVSAVFSVTSTASGEKILNGGFDDASNWTFVGGSIAAGKANWSAASFVNLRQTQTFIAGKSYRLILTTSNRTSGGIIPRFFNGTTVAGTARTTNGTFTEVMVALTGNTEFRIAGSSANDTISVDNVSLVQID